MNHEDFCDSIDAIIKIVSTPNFWTSFTLNTIISQMHHRIGYRQHTNHSKVIVCCVMYRRSDAKETLCCQLLWNGSSERQNRFEREKDWVNERERKKERKKSQIGNKSIIKTRSQTVNARGGMRARVCAYWMLFRSRFSSTMRYLCVGGLMHMSKIIARVHVRTYTHTRAQVWFVCMWVCVWYVLMWERLFMRANMKRSKMCAPFLYYFAFICL